jgi:CRISPR/Cas system CSM-associated protein Csm3 (group 7 of RAMP superfamily)
MSKIINYKITFLSYWHCGSGLSSGADLSSLVIKDKDKLPFVPGKTIKGLLREAVEKIQFYEKLNFNLVEIFGIEADEKRGIDAKQGCCFFTNAALRKDLREVIVIDKLQDFMYHSIAQTAIDDSGVTKKNSLREMQVTIPCELEGKILDVPDEDSDGNPDGSYSKILEKGLKLIKRLGQNRNRGLGRCIIQIEEGVQK